jgi:hypothetical protein
MSSFSAVLFVTTTKRTVRCTQGVEYTHDKRCDIFCDGRTHTDVWDFALHSPIPGHRDVNPLSPELSPICFLLALLTHDFLHVTRIRVKSLTVRLLMSYIYMEHLFLMFLDHTQRRSTVGRTPLDE